MASNTNNPLYGRFYLSDFSSLNFDANWKLPFQIQADYVQRFVQGDNIRVQFSMNYREIVTSIILVNNETSTFEEVVEEEIPSETDWVTKEVLINKVNEGSYTLNIYIILRDSNTYVIKSKFCILSEESDDLLKITYNHRRNEFNTVFLEGHDFDVRFEGDLLPSGMEFDVDSEGFRNQSGIYTQLYAKPYRREKLAIGGGFGVPNWVGEKINRIFSLSNVYINDVRYVRSEQSVPEITTIGNDYPLFIYQLQVEPQDQGNEMTLYDTEWRHYNTPYPENSVVTLANMIFSARLKTNVPPVGLLKAKGAYIMAGDRYLMPGIKINNEDWEQLLEI